jgi:hypothetical protein
VSSWPALNDVPFRSRGHLVRPPFATVRINAEARDAYLSLVTDTVLPDGSTVALFFGDEQQREAGPVYAMEKTHGGWRFLSTDSEGGLDPTLDPTTCSRCHDGAPADDLFGLPRSHDRKE